MKTTKRPGNPAYRRLNLVIVVTGVTASLLGAHLLQWQEKAVAVFTSSSTQPAASYPAIQLPASTDLQNPGVVTMELAPIPTVAAAAHAPLPRPVARTRSSR